MKEEKENVIEKVVCKLHGIKQMHEEAMQAQRQSFPPELEGMGENRAT